MFVARRVRTLVCLLLAVSTAVGAAVPARACACPAPSRTPTPPPAERVAQPAPAAKSCCQSAGKKRACCSAAPAGAAKAPCCDAKPRPEPAGNTDCQCSRCECDAPGVPPAPAVPPSFVPDADESVAASFAPPALIPGPAAAKRSARSAPVSPPTDLVISLSRLTC